MHKEWNLAPRSLVDAAVAAASAKKPGGGGTTIGVNQQFNTGLIGPATQITFTGNPYTPLTTGLALVLGAIQLIASGTADGVLVQILIGGVVQGIEGWGGALGSNTGAGTAWAIVPITKGAPITPGLSAINTNGAHTLTVLNPNQIEVAIIELQTH